MILSFVKLKLSLLFQLHTKFHIESKRLLLKGSISFSLLFYPIRLKIQNNFVLLVKIAICYYQLIMSIIYSHVFEEKDDYFKKFNEKRKNTIYLKKFIFILINRSENKRK